MNNILLNSFKTNNRFNAKNTTFFGEKADRNAINNNYQDNLISSKEAEAIKARNLFRITFGKRTHGKNIHGKPQEFYEETKINPEVYEELTGKFFSSYAGSKLFKSPALSHAELEYIDKILGENNQRLTLIDVREKNEIPDQYSGMFGKSIKNIDYHNMPILGNISDEEARKNFKSLVAKIDEASENKEAWPVVIQCQEGQFRSCLAIALYKMKKGKTAEEAFNETRELNWMYGRLDSFGLGCWFERLNHNKESNTLDLKPLLNTGSILPQKHLAII